MISKPKDSLPLAVYHPTKKSASNAATNFTAIHKIKKLEKHQNSSQLSNIIKYYYFFLKYDKQPVSISDKTLNKLLTLPYKIPFTDIDHLCDQDDTFLNQLYCMKRILACYSDNIITTSNLHDADNFSTDFFIRKYENFTNLDDYELSVLRQKLEGIVYNTKNIRITLLQKAIRLLGRVTKRLNQDFDFSEDVTNNITTDDNITLDTSFYSDNIADVQKKSALTFSSYFSHRIMKFFKKLKHTPKEPKNAVCPTIDALDLVKANFATKVRLSVQDSSKLRIVGNTIKFIACTYTSYLSLRQGFSGDCSHLSSLISLLNYENRSLDYCFRHVIYPCDINGLPILCKNGIYAVKIYILGEQYLVFVDDWLPFDVNGNCLLTHSVNQNEFWPSILSKAYYKLLGFSMKYGASNPTSELYRLTKWPVDTISIQTDSSVELNTFGDLILNNFNNCRCVFCCGTGTLIEQNGFILKDERILKTNGLVSNHAYSIIGAVKFNQTFFIRLRNPWGIQNYIPTQNEKSSINIMLKAIYPEEAKTTQEGSFWITLNSILKYFTFFYIAWPTREMKIYKCQLTSNKELIPLNSNNQHSLIQNMSVDILDPCFCFEVLDQSQKSNIHLMICLEDYETELRHKDAVNNVNTSFHNISLHKLELPNKIDNQMSNIISRGVFTDTEIVVRHVLSLAESTNLDSARRKFGSIIYSPKLNVIGSFVDNLNQMYISLGTLNNKVESGRFNPTSVPTSMNYNAKFTLYSNVELSVKKYQVANLTNELSFLSCSLTCIKSNYIIFYVTVGAPGIYHFLIETRTVIPYDITIDQVNNDTDLSLVNTVLSRFNIRVTCYRFSSNLKQAIYRVYIDIKDKYSSDIQFTLFASKEILSTCYVVPRPHPKLSSNNIHYRKVLGYLDNNKYYETTFVSMKPLTCCFVSINCLPKNYQWLYYVLEYSENPAKQVFQQIKITNLLAEVSACALNLTFRQGYYKLILYSDIEAPNVLENKSSLHPQKQSLRSHVFVLQMYYTQYIKVSNKFSVSKRKETLTK